MQVGKELEEVCASISNKVALGRLPECRNIACEPSQTKWLPSVSNIYTQKKGAVSRVVRMCGPGPRARPGPAPSGSTQEPLGPASDPPRNHPRPVGSRAAQEAPRGGPGPKRLPGGARRAPGGPQNHDKRCMSTNFDFPAESDFEAAQSAPRVAKSAPGAASEAPRAPQEPSKRRQERPRAAPGPRICINPGLQEIPPSPEGKYFRMDHPQ